MRVIVKVQAVPQPVTDPVPGLHWAVLCPAYLFPYTKSRDLRHSINVILHTYVAKSMRILRENSITYTYSSYQTLHPGGATHYYKFLAATSVS
jgi:hypothetical protein